MALFKTTEELRQYFPARMTFSIDDLKPVLNEVEQEYLAEQVLGQDQYDELHAAYQDDDLTPELQTLLDLCRPAVVGLGLHRYTGEANVEFTSGGLAVNGASDKRAPASEWRTRDFERKQLRSGMRGLDVLVNHLLGHAADYPLWQDSVQAIGLMRGFVRTTADFNTRVNIGNSGYLFMRLKPAVHRAELGPVQDTLCSVAFTEDLLAKIDAENLSAGEKEVVDLVKLAVTHLAMAESIVELSLTLDDRGITTMEGMLGGQTSTGPKSASDRRLQQRIEHHANLGSGYLKRLRNKLQELAEAGQLPLYAASPCYVPPGTTPGPQFKTDGPVASFMA